MNCRNGADETDCRSRPSSDCSLDDHICVYRLSITVLIVWISIISMGNLKPEVALLRVFLYIDDFIDELEYF